MRKIKESYRQLINGENPNFAIWSLLISGLLILFLLPFLLTWEKISFWNYSDTGPIGDTIGGIAGPAIALIGAFLTFLAFWVQVQSNKAQTLQFNKQDIDNKIDRVENKFYELLRLHRNNVDEALIVGFSDNNFEKRQVFSEMYKELRFLFFVVKNKQIELIRNNHLAEEYSDEDLLNLSYIFFYVGIHSDKLIDIMIGDKFNKVLYTSIRENLKSLQSHIGNLSLPMNINKPDPMLELSGLEKATLSRAYSPFRGYQNFLGNYYRHLYQTVKFVTKQDNILLNMEHKIDYLRTLRAQLSDYEQIMLYYNAISGFGIDWIKNLYFTDFKMIHNLPLPLADFGIVPEKKFEKEIKEGKDIFEWT